MILEQQKHLTAALGWLALGDWKSADAELERLTPEERAHPEVLLARVEILGQAGRWERALPMAQLLAQHHEEWSEGWRALYVLARCHTQLGRYQEAKDTLDQAIQAAPTDIRPKALDDPVLGPLWKNVSPVWPKP